MLSLISLIPLIKLKFNEAYILADLADLAD
jgi:hypothetical protein